MELNSLDLAFHPASRAYKTIIINTFFYYSHNIWMEMRSAQTVIVAGK